MKFESPHLFLRELAKALGLEGHPVQSILLVSEMQSVTTAYVKKLVTKEQGEALLEVLQRHPGAVRVVELSDTGKEKEIHAEQRDQDRDGAEGSSDQPAVD